MTAKEAEEMLDVMEKRAPALRAAGFLAVKLGEAAFTLAPAALDADDTETEPEEGPSDVLHDAWAHGVPPAGGPSVMPKRTRSPL